MNFKVRRIAAFADSGSYTGINIRVHIQYGEAYKCIFIRKLRSLLIRTYTIYNIHVRIQTLAGFCLRMVGHRLRF